MIEIIHRLSFAEQKQMLALIRPALALAPLSIMQMPNGMARRTNCTGICESCHTLDGSSKPFRVASTNLGDYGWTSAKCGIHYTDIHPFTGERLPPIPEPIKALAERLARASGEPSWQAQSCYINLYRPGDRLGIHQDRDEEVDAAIISINLGATGRFFWAAGLKDNYKSRPKGYAEMNALPLISGDCLIMNGEHRYAWHGLAGINPGSTPDGLGKPNHGDWRLNLTIRQYR